MTRKQIVNASLQRRDAPRIVISNKFLEDFGFFEGAGLVVEYQEGRIVITLENADLMEV